MQPYSNAGGNSNIIGFDKDISYIRVYFKDGSSYVYTSASCGQVAIDEMVQLAESGSGLNSYISRNRPNYDSKMS